MQLENVGEIVRIGAAQQLLQVLKKNFARDLGTEHLSLEGLPHPIDEDGVLRVQDGFVEKGDCRKCGQLYVVGDITSAHGLLGGGFKGFAGVMAERVGIGDALAIAAKAFDGGQDFLIEKRKVFRPAAGG